jgi:ABC-type branched-subunit amino acid transport system permease subunit
MFLQQLINGLAQGSLFALIAISVSLVCTIGFSFFLKVLAFTISCLIAGLAGAFYAHFITFISADQFGMNESFLILTMVVLGGTGSIIGPITGALILILVIVIKPEGLAGVKGLFSPASGARRFFFFETDLFLIARTSKVPSDP